MSRAWMEVRAGALRRNLATIGESVGPEVRLVPMVKADAYGLGLGPAVSALAGRNPEAFGVATVDEGLTLRDLGVDRPIWVLSPVPPGSEPAAVGGDLTVAVSDLPALDRLRQAGEQLGRTSTFHVEVDTGMGRAGFDRTRVGEWAPAIHEAQRGSCRWTGCFTHLHSADENAHSVAEQWRHFQAVLERCDPLPRDAVVHALNSAGALRCPEFAGDAVRPGIFLYGGGVGADLPAPEPVAAVHARVVRVREAQAGTTLGYGSTYASTGDEVWATASIGYGDGLPRALGNTGSALVRGRRVPIIGRISMDVTVVDITGVPDVGPGDRVTFIGSEGEERITVDEVATLVGTISYEILTGFTPRLNRVWEE